ncbi:MAG: hypothetical protein AAGD13_13415 [Pseudomonadota bacterium]
MSRMENFTGPLRELGHSAKTAMHDVGHWFGGNTGVNGLDLGGLNGAIADSGLLIGNLAKTTISDSGGSAILAKLPSAALVNVADLEEVATDAIRLAAAADAKTGGHAASAKQRVEEKARAAKSNMANAPLDSTKRKIHDVLKKLYDDVVGAFRSFTNKLPDWLKFIGREILDGLTTTSAQLLEAMARTLMSAAPVLGYVADGIQIGGGMYQAIKNAYFFGKMEIRTIGCEVKNGVPSLVMKALERHYIARQFNGLKNAGVGSLSIGLRATLDGMAGGSGAIAGLIIAAVTAVISFIDRLFERSALSFFFYQARQKALVGSHNDLQAAKREYKGFMDWLQNWMAVCPVVAALVFQTNYHDSGSFFKDHVQQTGSEETAFVRVRRDASKYLRQHQSEYALKFTSGDDELRNKINAGYVRV